MTSVIFASWWLNHPFEKYARQIGTFSPVGDENKQYLKPPPSLVYPPARMQSSQMKV